VARVYRRCCGVLRVFRVCFGTRYGSS
jgi:hypothetical protein